MTDGVECLGDIEKDDSRSPSFCLAFLERGCPVRDGVRRAVVSSESTSAFRVYVHRLEIMIESAFHLLFE